MTIIAYRDGVLAADTAIVAGDTMLPDCIVKIVKDRGSLAGAAGSATYNHAFLAWFLGHELGEPPTPVKDDGLFDIGIIVRPDGTIERHEPGGKFVITPVYYAVGSGEDVALGAFFAGADAEQACAAAIAHDTSCGGKITVLRA